jgi:peptide/nickel transport system permease protein
MVVVMALPLQSKLDLGPLHLALNLSHLDRIIIALAIVAWPPYARLLRAEVKKIKPQDFVEAAKAVGCSRLRVLWRHILPNSVGPVLSLAFLNVGGVLIAVSTLSFLGFGPPIGYAEWGLIMAGARSYLIFSTGPSSLYVLVILIPGAFLSSYVIGWSLMGDTLVCMTDPTFRRRVSVWESRGSS